MPAPACNVAVPGKLPLSSQLNSAAVGGASGSLARTTNEPALADSTATVGGVLSDAVKLTAWFARLP